MTNEIRVPQSEVGLWRIRGDDRAASARRAGFQPAGSLASSRWGCGFVGGLRIGNPRYGRLPTCATSFAAPSGLQAHV